MQDTLKIGENIQNSAIFGGFCLNIAFFAVCISNNMRYIIPSMLRFNTIKAPRTKKSFALISLPTGDNGTLRGSIDLSRCPAAGTNIKAPVGLSSVLPSAICEVQYHDRCVMNWVRNAKGENGRGGNRGCTAPALSSFSIKNFCFLVVGNTREFNSRLFPLEV